MPQTVVRTWKDLEKIEPRQNALIEVPGGWVRGVAGVVALAQEFKDSGLIVTNVGPCGAGARAGIARGDILLRYDGVELDAVDRLRAMTGGKRPGAIARIEAMRSDAERHFEVASGALGITVSAPLHRLKLAKFTKSGPRTLESLILGGWKPS